MNPGLARRFKIEEAFKFEDFNDAELMQIMEKKMKEQDLGATDHAKTVALEILNRAKNRPNFGNGGEVENLLSKAKEQCMARRTRMPLKDRPKFIIFEPQDFDKDHDRNQNAAQNLAKLFEDIVGHQEIITRLAKYQKIAETCKQTGRDPRAQVPTNFVFTGPPGMSISFLILVSKCVIDIPPLRYWQDDYRQKDGECVLRYGIPLVGRGHRVLCV